MTFKKLANLLIRGVRLDNTDTGFSSPGWHRVYAIEKHRAYGYYGEFCICSTFNQSMNTVIKFNVMITHSEVKIHVLDSCGATDVIDKIRITRSTANEEQCYMDIHYNLTNYNKLVFKCMFELRGNTISGNTSSFNGALAEDNPTGENVITEVYAYKQ